MNSIFATFFFRTKLSDKTPVAHVFVDVAGERFGASLQQLDEQPQDQLRGVVLRAHQQQRLLQLLDVELQKVEGLPATKTGAIM
jgi:hypothetical protein